jgi:hypothetical protein
MYKICIWPQIQWPCFLPLPKNVNLAETSHDCPLVYNCLPKAAFMNSYYRKFVAEKKDVNWIWCCCCQDSAALTSLLWNLEVGVLVYVFHYFFLKLLIKKKLSLYLTPFLFYYPFQVPEQKTRYQKKKVKRVWKFDIFSQFFVNQYLLLCRASVPGKSGLENRLERRFSYCITHRHHVRIVLEESSLDWVRPVTAAPCFKEHDGGAWSQYTTR